MKKQSSNSRTFVQRKTPDELKSKTQKATLSCRVDVDARKVLEKEAKRTKTSLSDLAAGILEDYVEWLQDANKQNAKD